MKRTMSWCLVWQSGVVSRKQLWRLAVPLQEEKSTNVLYLVGWPHCKTFAGLARDALKIYDDCDLTPPRPQKVMWVSEGSFMRVHRRPEKLCICPIQAFKGASAISECVLKLVATGTRKDLSL